MNYIQLYPVGVQGITKKMIYALYFIALFQFRNTYTLCMVTSVCCIQCWYMYDYLNSLRHEEVFLKTLFDFSDLKFVEMHRNISYRYDLNISQGEAIANNSSLTGFIYEQGKVGQIIIYSATFILYLVNGFAQILA